MKLMLRIDSVNLDKPTEQWWNNDGNVRNIAEALDAAGFWQDLHWYGLYGEKKHRFETVEDFLKLKKMWKPGVTYEIFSDAQDTAQLKVTIYLYRNIFDVHVLFRPEYAEKNPQLLNQCITFLKKLADVNCSLGPSIDVEVHDLEFEVPLQRLHPPRYHRHFNIKDTLVTVLDKRYHLQESYLYYKDAVKLATALLPDGVRKSEHGDLLIFEWTQSTTDLQQLAKDCFQYEKWLAETLQLPINSSYNELGDKRESLFMLSKETYGFTFFVSNIRTGYLAVIEDEFIDAKSEIRKRLAKLLAWAATQKRIKVALIFPNRENIIKNKKLIESLGIAFCCYPHASGEGYWRVME